MKKNISLKLSFLLIVSLWCSGIGNSEKPQDKINDNTLSEISTNVKLGKGIFRISDKITIYHYLHGEIEFKGEDLKHLIEKLNASAHDEWWTKKFLSSGSYGFKFMIECSIKRAGSLDKYDVIALFPLSDNVLKQGKEDDLNKLLPPHMLPGKRSPRRSGN
jgi:hypothetical protein